MINIEQKSQREHVVTSMVDDLCVWSGAEEIKPVECGNTFENLGCSTDHQVLENLEEQNSTAGKTDQRSPGIQLLMSQGRCLHMLTGLISFGLCTYGYNCAKCSLDQMIEDSNILSDPRAAVVETTSGFTGSSH
jgi:hypothetical protein